jgi:hypothetical protein
MKLFETVRLLAKGLIKLGRGDETPPPGDNPLNRAVPFEEKTPVYSLKSPSPVWRSGTGMSLAPPAVAYPALNAEKTAPPREDVAELVYRRFDFDSRLVSQPMDEEELDP